MSHLRRVPDGAPLLDEVADLIGGYVVFPSEHCLTAVTLWVAHTHAIDSFYVTPRLVLDSAEPGSGKTRVLELLALLTNRPKLTISTTTAALYRRIADEPITVLLDEADAVFGKVTTPQNEDLRALLNAGYKRGSTVDRCVGDGAKIKVVEFPVFSPVALAGLAGRMPPTITTRSVTIHMRRRAPGEKVKQFRERDAEGIAAPIRESLAAWMTAAASALADARPEMPDRVEDRPAEVWEALLAVADAAGGDWPKRAREACKYFVLGSDPAELSRGVRLLRDVRAVFAIRDGEGQVIGQRDNMQTAALVDALVALEEAPWADLYGKSLDARRLAAELKRYGVEPTQYRLPESGKLRGYLVHGPKGLGDAWSRYLLPAEAGTAGTAGTEQARAAPDQLSVPDASGTDLTPGTGMTSEVPAVPAVPAPPRTCVVCGLAMTAYEPNQTSHPTC